MGGREGERSSNPVRSVVSVTASITREGPQEQRAVHHSACSDGGGTDYYYVSGHGLPARSRSLASALVYRVLTRNEIL